jgi:xanthine dehydrogenase YagT iron-sulfur-binding subunit
MLLKKQPAVEKDPAPIAVKMKVNGTDVDLIIDARTTLLDMLRENLDLTGSKKGCDQGQCGACTVHINGKRSLSCLTLAVSHDGDEITTIEGLAKGEALHPMQQAFLECDGFQCGFCTPGQIMSAVSVLEEAGLPSYVTSDVSKAPTELSREEIRERMSGNICRCGAYPNIVDAIQKVRAGR